MDEANPRIKHKAHLFTLRIWAVNEEATAPQWRSRLQNIQNGEVHFFRDWQSLIASIEDALHENFIEINDERGK